MASIAESITPLEARLAAPQGLIDLRQLGGALPHSGFKLVPGLLKLRLRAQAPQQMVADHEQSGRQQSANQSNACKRHDLLVE